VPAYPAGLQNKITVVTATHGLSGASQSSAGELG
jgi:hypothetical protein